MLKLWVFTFRRLAGILGEGGDEVKNPAADLGIADKRERPVQLQPFRRREKVDDVGTRFRLSEAGRRRFAQRGVFKEKRRRDVQYAREVLQPAGADAVGALFGFLKLLEGYMECGPH